jgi:tryptophanyl-tRNA synthetase
MGCIDCKRILAGNMEIQLGPVRERYHELCAQPTVVEQALAEGAHKARTVATETMREVRVKTGLA